MRWIRSFWQAGEEQLIGWLQATSRSANELTPRQRRVTIGVLVGLLLIAVFVGIAIAALVLSALAIALAATGSTPLAAPPQIHVSLLVGGQEHTTETEIRIEQLKVEPDSIVSDERGQSWATAPPDPEAPRPAMLAAFGPSTSFLDPFQSQRTNGGRRHLSDELDSFEERLRSWLQHHESAMWPAAAAVELQLRVENMSMAAAKDVVVTVTMPDGVHQIESLTVVDPPPDRPQYREDLWFSPTRGLPDLRMRRAVPVKLRSPDADLVQDRGRTYWRQRFRLLVHRSAERSRDVLVLVPERPGQYTFDWRVSSPSLRSPLQGTFVLSFVENAPHPITTLCELLDLTPVAIG